MNLDLLHKFANTEIFCLFHNCMWQSRHPEINVYLLAAVWTNRWIVPILMWSASTFSSASLSWSKRSTDTGPQLLTNIPVLTLVLSQSNKTRLSTSWALEPDGCSLLTSLPVLTIGFLVFGCICWEDFTTLQQLLNPKFPPIVFKRNPEGGRGDAHTFSYLISPVSIMIVLGIQ